MTTTSPERLGSSAALLPAIARWSGWRGVLPTALLVLVYVSIGTQSPAFFSITSIRQVGTQAAPLIFLAVGLTPIIIMGGIDLSLAALTSLCSILIVELVPTGGWGAMIGVLAIASTFGAAIGFVHAHGQIPSFVATLGALGLYTGLALQISDASNEPLTAHLEVVTWSNMYFAGLPAGFVVAVLFAVAVWLGMRYLTIGRYAFAIGANEAAAQMSGIRTIRVRVALFALAGLSAALAAIPLVSRTTFASPSLAHTLLLPAIAAVVVGGTAISGGVGGALHSLVGALTVTVIQVGLIVVDVNTVIQSVIFGLILIVAVALTTDRSKLPTVK
jgi:ribose transport system permease protein